MLGSYSSINVITTKSHVTPHMPFLQIGATVDSQNNFWCASAKNVGGLRASGVAASFPMRLR